jgi:hypothetical protein
MHALRIARLSACAVAALAWAAVAGLALAGCAGSGGAGARAGGSGPAGPPPGGTVQAIPRPAGSGLAAAQISRFRWSVLPASPLGPREDPALAWAGTELVELGGLKGGLAAGDGAAFSPATGRWHRIASPPRGVGLWNAVSVWTGRQLLVAGGHPGSCRTGQPGGGTPPGCRLVAGLYDPAADRWSATTLPLQMAGLSVAAAVWTGRDIIVAGVDAGRGRLGVAAYNTLAGAWRVITPALPAGHPPRNAAMVAADGRLILWSLWERVRSGNGYSGVDVIAMSPAGAWRAMTTGWPQHQEVGSPAFTGTAVLVGPGQVWCGLSCVPPMTSYPGYVADPATLARTIIPSGPLGLANPAFIWTGRAIIAVNLHSFIGGGGQATIRPGDTALWDPAASRWLRLPAPPGAPAISAVPVWTGARLLALTAAGRLLSLQR